MKKSSVILEKNDAKKIHNNCAKRGDIVLPVSIKERCIRSFREFF